MNGNAVKAVDNSGENQSDKADNGDVNEWKQPFTVTLMMKMKNSFEMPTSSCRSFIMTYGFNSCDKFIRHIAN